jgi:(hydroxyamino)benzene mutase
MVKTREAVMIPSNNLSRQGHRLLQIGVALILFTCFEGFAVPYFASPDLGRSVHTLSALSAVLLLALGLTWPRLTLGQPAAQVAFWLLVYSDFAIVAAFLMGAIWGAGNSTMPIAAGAAHGTDFQEMAIAIVAYTSAPTGIISFALILWGLRIEPLQAVKDREAIR